MYGEITNEMHIVTSNNVAVLSCDIKIILISYTAVTRKTAPKHTNSAYRNCNFI